MKFRLPNFFIGKTMWYLYVQKVIIIIILIIHRTSYGLDLA